MVASAPRWTGHHALLFAFTIAYMAPAAAVCLRGGNREFFLYLGVMVLLIGAVSAVHQAIGLHIATLWGLSLWGLAHLAGGLVSVPESWPHEDSLVLYDWWLIPQRLRYDQVIHAFGFGLTTWVCWQGLSRAFTNRGVTAQPTLGLLTLCAAGGMGFGALNEIVEFLAVLTIPNTNVGGYINTGWDLVFNAAGCLIAAVAIRLASQRTALQ
ncbi:MAG TPA: hypothetical protein VM165_14500 [Planctomycetaceae bacterium]|nr:hypothetical protein [Planctomycetaceae bacterium]